MKAVVEINGHQYLVEKGDKIVVDGKTAGKQQTETVPLMVIDNGKTMVGKPYVDGATVRLRKVGDTKSDKVTSIRFKAKKRVKKIRGARQAQTELEVVSVSVK